MKEFVIKTVILGMSISLILMFSYMFSMYPHYTAYILEGYISIALIIYFVYINVMLGIRAIKAKRRFIKKEKLC